MHTILKKPGRRACLLCNLSLVASQKPQTLSGIFLSLVMLFFAFETGSGWATEFTHSKRSTHFIMGILGAGTNQFEKVKSEGFNAVHVYSNLNYTPDSVLDLLKQMRLQGPALLGVPEVSKEDALSEFDYDTVAEYVKRQSERNEITFWAFPEELRYWGRYRKIEFEKLVRLSSIIKEHDKAQRPGFMYFAGNYRAEQMSQYIPYLGLVGAGSYTAYLGAPSTYTRWRVEESRRAIALAGFDERNKTPVCVLGILPKNSTNSASRNTSPSEFRYDLYACLQAGGKGVLAFSYARAVNDGFQPVIDEYSRATELLTGPLQLSEYFISGRRNAKDLYVSLGNRVPMLSIPGWKLKNSAGQVVLSIPSYPAARAVGWDKGKKRLVIVTNAAQARHLRFNVLADPISRRTQRIAVLGEDRYIEMVNGIIREDFPPLGSRMYLIE